MFIQIPVLFSTDTMAFAVKNDSSRRFSDVGNSYKSGNSNSGENFGRYLTSNNSRGYK